MVLPPLSAWLPHHPACSSSAPADSNMWFVAAASIVSETKIGDMLVMCADKNGKYGMLWGITDSGHRAPE